MRFARVLVVSAAVLVILGFLLSRGGGPSGAGGDVSVNPRLVVGAQNTITHALFHVAVERGFFAEEGVDVDVKVFPSSLEINEAVLANRVDVGFVADSAIVLASKAPVRVFSVVSKGLNRRRILVPVGSDVRSITDLDGKRIGLKKNAAYYGNWLQFEKYYGIKAAEVIDMEHKDMPEALKTGQVDAVFTFDPTAALIESKGYGRWVQVQQVPGMGEVTVAVAKQATLEGKADAVRRFIRALRRAEAYMRGNRGESVRIMCEVTSLPADIVEKSMSFSEYSTGITEDVRVSYDKQAEFFVEQGIIGEKPGALFDVSYYDSA